MGAEQQQQQQQQQEQATPSASQQQSRVIASQGLINPAMTPQPRPQAAGGSSSMTLFDNLTSQLTPERKERFIELFKKLQSNSVTANQFLAQARLLLDQQQYQQLENLKNKPVQPMMPRPVSIQPQTSQQQQQQQQQQQLQLDYNTLKRTMSGSQLRPEDAHQRAILHPQLKRADIPIQQQQQPVPIYRSNTAPPSTMDHQHTGLQPDNIDPSIKNEMDGEQLSVVQDFMNQDILKGLIAKISASLDTVNVQPEVYSMIALATQERIQKLIKDMIEASKYRMDSQTFTQPPPDEAGRYPYKIVDVQDVKKQLLAIERVEREEERRRREYISERERRSQMGEDDKEGGDDDKPKKKKKKDQGGISARYMSDDVRNKSTNETALMIAGGVKKSWMLTGLAGGTKDMPSFTPSKPPASSPPNNLPPSSITATPTNASSPTSGQIQSPTLFQHPTTSGPMSPQDADDQPRGRGRPKRRKSGSGPDMSAAKKPKAFRDGLFLPPSTIGRPQHRFFGEQGVRKVTVRDALFVLEDEYENKKEYAPRTLLKTYTCYLK